MAKKQQAIFEEIAGIDDGRDITRGFYTGMLEPTDQVIKQKGGQYYYDLYIEMLEHDDQIFSCFQQRRLALISKNWVVEPGGTSAQDKAAADFIRETLDRIEWDDINDKMLHGVYFGFAVAECLWVTDGSYITIDRIKSKDIRRFRFNADSNLLLLTSSQPQGELVPPRKFWSFVAGGFVSDEPYGRGLATHLYWPSFFKRNDLKFWLMFLEKFGMPTVKAVHPTGMSEAQKKRLKEGLRGIQNDSVVMVPEGTALELLEASRSGTADYAKLHDQMNQAIAKIILGQVMTSETVGGQYKAEVQKQIRDEVVQGDSDLINRSFCAQVVRWLVDWNFPGAAIPKIWREVTPPLDIKEVAAKDKLISELGYKPTEAYIKQTYGEGWVARNQEESSLLPISADAAFAESDKITQAKAMHRQRQDDILAAAKLFASQYESLIGAQVNQLLGYLDSTGDLVTFRQRLNEMVNHPPRKELVEKIERMNFAARLSGLAQGQKA